MKGLIDKLASGNIEYDLPKAELSAEKIEITTEAGITTRYELSFDSKDEREIKGVVFSSDIRVSIINEQFVGKHNAIKFFVSTENMVQGECYDGQIEIVSNAGDFVIPFTVTALPVELETSMGKIKTIEEFTKLVMTEYEEALKLFMSKDFKAFIIGRDVWKTALYDRLMKNGNKEIAMEEFLVAMKQKDAVSIAITNSEKVYENITEAYGDILTITRDHWGYVDIDVEIKGVFLHNCKEKITNDDFTGNTFEYQYLINYFKLNQGINKAQITLKTTMQTITYDIIVKNPSNDVSETISRGRDLITIMKSYMKFRYAKVSGNKWIADMTLLSEKMLQKNEKDMVALLLNTQVAILSGNEDKAISMLGRLSQMVNSTQAEKVEYYCYYLYLRAVHKKNATFTDNIKREIKTYFENGYDKWSLLWMIIYLDDRYTQNPSLRYTLIKEQFNKGCTSPVMYFEAVSVLNEQPALLRILNPFEVQVLSFAAKNGIINDRLAKQLLELIQKEKSCSKIMLRLLKNIYKTNKDVEVLNGICRLLINGSYKDADSFEWYEAGVKADLKLADLMEYYIYSIDKLQYTKLLPSVYMYFNYNAESLLEDQAYLYAGIIKNKEELPGIYEKYEGAIKKYAIKQIQQGNINRNLKVVYDEVLSEELITEAEMATLPAILNTYEIVVENDNITDVLVCHKESVEVEQVRFIHSKAYVTIYTENPVILFIDNMKRKLCNVDYKITKMLNKDDLLELCKKSELDNQYLTLSIVNECLKNPSQNKGKSDLLCKAEAYKLLTESYRSYLTEGIVDYCFNNYDGGDLNHYLLEIDMDRISENGRNKVMEILIKRGMYRQTYGYIMKYSPFGIPQAVLLKFVTNIIKGSEFAPDEKMLELCRTLFSDGQYNKTTMLFLQKYFEGPTNKMVEMWKACIDLEVDDYTFEERLVVQMIFEGRKNGILYEVFEAYAKRGRGDKIKKAYYTYVSYNYYIKGNEMSDVIFELLEKDMQNGFRVTDICKIAYLGYIVLKKDINREQIAFCKQLIYDLTELNIVFEFYKKFNKWFKMPYSILDKTLIDYRTNPKNKVFITYTIFNSQGDEVKTLTEEMRSVYPGIFTKQLTMFYGEKVIYTIEDRGREEVKNIEEQSITLKQKDIYNDESRFGQINGMLICEEVKREDALDELMKNYEFNRQAADELFKLL